MKGFVPTPDGTVDLMVELLFRERPPERDARVLDPGAGRGAFVAGILRHCARRSLPVPDIVAVELDPAHVGALREAFAGDPRVEVRHGDFLAAEPGTFDYIIGNPPYVAITGLNEVERASYRRAFRSATGRFDLYLLFFEQALRSLRPGGRLVFITPEKYLYVNTAAALRQMLAEARIRELRFLAEDTFPDLVTYPLITVLDRAEPAGDVRIHDRDGSCRSIDAVLGAASWLPVLRGAGRASDAGTLADITVRISCGVATGADPVFVMERSEVPQPLQRFAHPTIAGRDIVDHRLPGARRAMLVPYSRDGRLLQESELGPLRDFLEQPGHRERLLARTCVRRKPWYAFHENPPLTDILRPKLLCKDIGARPLFVIDREGSIVPRHSVYYIVPRDPGALDELAEYLNSERAARWLGDHCQRAANGFLRLQSHVLKRIPLPPSLDPGKRQLELGVAAEPRRRSA